MSSATILSAVQPSFLACPFADAATADFVVSDAERQSFREQGYVILRGVVCEAAIAPIREEILGILRARNMADSYLAQTHEYLAGSYLDRWINSRVLATAAESFMGPSARLYLPFTAVKGPGMGEFTFHQDNNYTRLDGPALNCWTAFTPMRVDNGCLRVVPKSHGSGTVESTNSEQCQGHRRVVNVPTTWDDAIMEPGDVCVFDRLTVHGSGPNQSADPRIGYAVQFHRHDTKALIDGTWVLLRDHPRYVTTPVVALSPDAHRGE